MNRLPLICSLAISIAAMSVAVGAARGGEKQTPFIPSYVRSQLAFSTEPFGGVHALSENGVAVGSLEGDVPARWVDGQLDWSGEKLNGTATCVSDDGAWLSGGNLDGTLVFRKHADEAIETLPLLQGDKGDQVTGYPTGIRGDGTTVGVCRIDDGETVAEHAVRWNAGGEIERLLPNTPLSRAAAINEAGDIVGSYKTTPEAPVHAFLLTDGELLDPTVGAKGSSAATAISPSGFVVGTFFDEKLGATWFLLRGEQLTLIPVTQVGGGDPSAVNDSGLIVGNAQEPVAWLDGRFYKLNDLLSRSDRTSILAATDVNNAGQIAANGYERAGFISEHYSANVLFPLEAGPDLQGRVENLRVRSIGGPSRRVFRVSGTLVVKNAGSERARASVAEIVLESAPSTERRQPGSRPIRVRALAPGEEQRVRFDAGVSGPRGAVQVQILLDARHRVPETNETNNLIQVAPR